MASSATIASAVMPFMLPRVRGFGSGGPCEWPGSRPSRLSRNSEVIAVAFEQWAKDNVVKVLCFCHPPDEEALWAVQEATVKRLYEAARRNDLEFLLEVIPSKGGGRRRHDHCNGC